MINYCIYYHATMDTENLAAMSLRGLAKDPKLAHLHQVYSLASYFSGGYGNSGKTQFDRIIP